MTDLEGGSNSYICVIMAKRIDVNIAENLYKELKSIKLVAEKLKCNPDSVSSILKRNGIKVNRRIEYYWNKDFFNTDSENVFYWAGFIAADGCLSKTNKSYRLKICLSSKDIEHLKKFKQSINSTHPIHKFWTKVYNEKWNSTETCEINVLDKKLKESLMKFNITERKTHTYKFPEHVLNHKYLNHFMRGYFDGDGCWYKSHYKITPQAHFGLRGTPEFLTVYRQILEKECNLVKVEKDIKINCNIGQLQYAGNGISSRIRNFLYKDATVYLERKYDIVKNAKTIR